MANRTITFKSLVAALALWAGAARATNSYIVHFDGNGGVGTMPDQTFACDQAAPLAANAFTRDDYFFAGWATTPDGEVAYADGATVSNLAAANASMTLYARWSNTFHAIRFDANGGVGAMPDQYLLLGAPPAALSANAFARDGCIFLGWATSAGGEAEFLDGDSADGLATTPGGVTTLYAIWRDGADSGIYAIRFDAADGFGAMRRIFVVCGEDVSLPPNAFRRIGYGFAGWATGPDAAATLGDCATIAGGFAAANGAIVTLYAVWTERPWTPADYLDAPGLSFTTTGGAGWAPDLETWHDGLASFANGGLPPADAVGTWTNTTLSSSVLGAGMLSFWWKVNCEWNDEEYDEWYDFATFSVDGVEAARIAGDSGWRQVECELSGVGPHKLEWTFWRDDYDEDGAEWENRLWVDGVSWAQTPVPVLFDANGGEGTMASFDLYRGTDQFLPRCEFTNTNGFFLGWALAADGEATLLDGDSTADLAFEQGETITLYAVWHEGSGGNGLLVRYYDISSSGYSTWTQSEAAMTNYFANRTPTIETNTLAFGDTLQSGFQLNNVGSYFSNYPDLWLDHVSTNRYHGKYANQSQNNFAMFYEGFLIIDVSGTYSFASACDDQVVLYADGTLIVASDKWDQTPKTGSISLSKGSHRIVIATYEGGGAQGMWVEWKKPGDTSYSPLPQSVLSYGSPAYAVRFDANGGEGSMFQRVFASGEDVALPATAFTCDGYTFAGWATSADGPIVCGDGETVAGGFTAASGETITLYARWSRGTYSVHFDANGGVGAMPNQTFWLGIPDALPPSTFSRTGYAFGGWATEVGDAVAYADKAVVTDVASAVGAAVTLHAVWVPNEYSVAFHYGTSSASQSFTYDAAQPLRANSFARTGYTFSGWAAEEGGEAVYADSAVVSNLAVEAGGVVDLYATWTPNAYTVRFDANGGRGTMANQSFTYDEAAALSANAFTRADHFFAGWATEAGGAVAYDDGATISNLTAAVNGVVTLYAVWADACVTFDANGGEGTMETFLIFADAEQTLAPCAFTNTNGFFLGWALAADGDATFLDEDSTADLNLGQGDAITLYAKWHEGVGGKYLVLDLSAGSSAESYPASCFAVPPDGGFNTDEYKTTKLVLRRIEPGSFIMGGGSDESHGVTLTKPFYCGVFEVTQRQYELVTGSNPSYYRGDKRPVEQVSWNTIRGDSGTCNWPSSANVDSNSFMGRLRTRTGLDFDLPTEAQWEYACRAGTMTHYNSGKNYTNSSQDSAMDEVGRYGFNNGYQGGIKDGKGGYSDNHTAVGSYIPNAWGLYDMHGNVFEWCLDWDGVPAYGTDPKGSSSGTKRILRGGDWGNPAYFCTSFNRSSITPSGGYNYVGFRLSSALSLFSFAYAIRFDANGGEGVMSKRVYASGENIVLPEATFTRKDRSFVGWSTNADDTVAFAAGETVPGGFNAANGESVTLYAVWGPKVWTLAEAVDADAMSFTTGGDADWSVDVENGWTNGVSAKSGVVTNGLVSWIETTVTGGGTLAFNWKVMGGIYRNNPFAYAKAEVDGVNVAQTHLTDGWAGQTVTVEGAGEHTIRWTYLRTSARPADGDCAWLDAVVWTPEAPESIEVDGVEVPVNWLEEYPTLVEEHSGIHEAAANAIAANGVNTVAECYVAGLVPTNAADVFRAVISWKDGAPVITWEPDLNEGGTKQERVYTVEGRESLTQGSWGPTNTGSRFFRVKVELP